VSGKNLHEVNFRFLRNNNMSWNDELIINRIAKLAGSGYDPWDWQHPKPGSRCFVAWRIIKPLMYLAECPPASWHPTDPVVWRWSVILFLLTALLLFIFRIVDIEQSGYFMLPFLLFTPFISLCMCEFTRTIACFACFKNYDILMHGYWQLLTTTWGPFICLTIFGILYTVGYTEDLTNWGSVLLVSAIFSLLLAVFICIGCIGMIISKWEKSPDSFGIEVDDLDEEEELADFFAFTPDFDASPNLRAHVKRQTGGTSNGRMSNLSLMSAEVDSVHFVNSRIEQLPPPGPNLAEGSQSSLTGDWFQDFNSMEKEGSNGPHTELPDSREHTPGLFVPPDQTPLPIVVDLHPFPMSNSKAGGTIRENDVIATSPGF